MHQPSRLTRTAVAGAAAAVLAAPPALARIDPPATPAYNAREPTPPVVIVRDDAGFDWGAAAIGAGGTGALAVVVVLGTAALSTRQQIGAK